MDPWTTLAQSLNSLSRQYVGRRGRGHRGGGGGRGRRGRSADDRQPLAVGAARGHRGATSRAS